MPHTPSPSTTLDGDRAVGERRRLLGLAYRLTGSWTDAEDATQDAFARWYALPTADRDAIRSPAAWLTTVTSRICLDLLGSARVRRERYVGPWLPEPLPGALHDLGAQRPVDPAERAEVDETLGMAFLVVLDSMSPAERVAFVLHDVFGYPYDEIAGILGRTPAASRQLASSARRRGRAARTATASTEEAAIVGRLRRAWEQHDIDALVGILDPEVAMVADGGGVVSAAAHPVVGADAVARYFTGVTRAGGDSASGTLSVRDSLVNGRPGLVAERDGAVVTVAAFAFDRGRITRVWVVRNPDKLALWASAG